MTWERMEDGMKVTVVLSRISEKPMAPADQLVGLWQLETKEDNHSEFLFIRWDRIYREQGVEGRQTGYWHINAHRPHVTFLPHSSDKEPQSWSVKFESDALILTGLSNSNTDVVLRYKRLDAFPE